MRITQEKGSTTPGLTLLRGEVELHKQPRLSVAVPHADPHNHRVAATDVHRSGRGDPPPPGALGPSLGPAAPVVDGDRDGHTVVQAGDRDMGSIFRAELHGRHLSGDGVVGHVVEGEGVGLHLTERNAQS